LIEIALGILVIAATIPILMGAGDTLRLPVGDLFPILGFGGTFSIAAIGLILVLHGAYRLAKKRRQGSLHALRTLGLMWVMVGLVVFFGLMVPLFAAPLNVAGLGGVPLGYYIAAQGSLIAIVMLAFIHAAKQDAIDEEEGASNR
jgi:putative solute:sodium symporter small subunit